MLVGFLLSLCITRDFEHLGVAGGLYAFYITMAKVTSLAAMPWLAKSPVSDAVCIERHYQFPT